MLAVYPMQRSSFEHLWDWFHALYTSNRLRNQQKSKQICLWVEAPNYKSNFFQSKDEAHHWCILEIQWLWRKRPKHEMPVIWNEIRFNQKSFANGKTRNCLWLNLTEDATIAITGVLEKIFFHGVDGFSTSKYLPIFVSKYFFSSSLMNGWLSGLL